MRSLKPIEIPFSPVSFDRKRSCTFQSHFYCYKCVSELMCKVAIIDAVFELTQASMRYT